MDKARELGEMLASSEEYRRYCNAEIKQLNDPEAQLILDEYNTKKALLLQQMGNDNLKQEDVESIKAQLMQEATLLNQNQVLSEYIQASTEFSNILADVNNVISFFVRGESPGCQGCSSCQNK